MSTERQSVTARDLIEEAKKRIVFLTICVVGLSYIMSLTSSSVWVNLPAAAFLIIILRYFSLDYDMRRKAAAYNSKPLAANNISQRKPFESPNVVIDKFDWKRKVNSPVVEDAIDQFNRHLISEWVTDLWYSRITSDRQVPEELVQIMNDVLGEISCRMRNINLIDFLTRDIIHLICMHLELFRLSQKNIAKQPSRLQTLKYQDLELKSVLATNNKLHPALFSAEAEHKVLQHLMEALVSLTFRPEDLQCSLFRYIVREILACLVIRPVVNLATPRFINERIESLVISSRKAGKGAQVVSQSRPNGSVKISVDNLSRSLDPSSNGVELMQLKKDQHKPDAEKSRTDRVKSVQFSKDPLLSIDTRSTRSWSSLPSDSQTGDKACIHRHNSGGEWGDKLDLISQRKTAALAPEHFENMWAKGRNYKKEDANRSADPVSQSSLAESGKTMGRSKVLSGTIQRQSRGKGASHSLCNEQSLTTNLLPHNDLNISNHSSSNSYEEEEEHNLLSSETDEMGISGSDSSEDDETSNITGLDSPGVKVWDGKSNRHHSLSYIHHPLESSGAHKTKRIGKECVHSQKLPGKSGRKRSGFTQKVDVWQEVERTSFLSGDGQDVLNPSKESAKFDGFSDDYEAEILVGRIHSGAAASSSLSTSASSLSLASIPGSYNLAVNAPRPSVLADSFLTLRCEVLGANIVRSGSKTFAVYAISVTDVDNNNWSIKRRFRHFEELHRRLKEFPEYNLHLPPKHFLSTGLDVPVIQERCILLDKYLKKLLQLPTISGSIEVWDFLSVDSQTYIFSNSISIIETLSVGLGDTPHEKSKGVVNAAARPTVDLLSSSREHLSAEGKGFISNHSNMEESSRLNMTCVTLSPRKKSLKEPGKSFGDSGSDSDSLVQKKLPSTGNSQKTTTKVIEADDLNTSSMLLSDAADDPTFPSEWVPPSLSIPIFDLVDVIFQLQDGGWIRRKAFWVAKQVLQLGMGDAFDDWLIEKIQLLRKGSVVASGIKRLEQILWPDGIFITKHPKRRQPTPSGTGTQSFGSANGPSSTPQSSPKLEDIQQLDELQQQETERRAKFVYELMIDNAPAAIVGLVGRKEYEQCAKDLYYFLQSSVCLKQLAFDLLELLLSSAFPEMDCVFKQLQSEKEKFGEYKPS